MNKETKLKSLIKEIVKEEISSPKRRRLNESNDLFLDETIERIRKPSPYTDALSIESVRKLGKFKDEDYDGEGYAVIGGGGRLISITSLLPSQDFKIFKTPEEAKKYGMKVVKEWETFLKKYNVKF